MYKKVYSNKINNLPEPYDAKQNMKAFEKMINGDIFIKKEIIEHNLRFVLSQVKHFSNTSYEVEELFSIGTIGLIKAVDSFDIAKGNAFATYAGRCINNEILMFMRHEQKFSKQESMDGTFLETTDGSRITLEETLQDEKVNLSASYIEDEEKRELFASLEEFSERDKKILFLAYGLLDGKEYNQPEIAKMLNISQSYVSRILTKVYEAIKEKLINNNRVEDFDVTTIDPLLNMKMFIKFLSLFPKEMQDSYCSLKGIKVKNKRVLLISNPKLNRNKKLEIETMEAHLKYMIDDYFKGIKQDKTKKEIFESFVSKMKNRNLLFRFSRYSSVEIKEALKFLSEEEKHTIIKRHGHNLNNFYPFSKKNYQKQFRWYTLAVQKLEIILFLQKNREQLKKDLEIADDEAFMDSFKYFTIKEITILCSGGGYINKEKIYNDIIKIIKSKRNNLEKIHKNLSPIFQKYSKEEIREALPILSKEELTLFLWRHGKNLNQKNPWSTDQKPNYYYYNRYAKIVKKLIKYIENKKQIKSEFVIKYGFNSVAEAKVTIALLTKAEQTIIYLKWGEDLNTVKSFPRNDIRKSFAEYSKEYDEAIHHLKQLKKEQEKQNLALIKQEKLDSEIKNNLLEEKLSLKKAELFNSLLAKYKELIDAKTLKNLIDKIVTDIHVSNNEYIHTIENELFVHFANHYKESIDTEEGYILMERIKGMFLTQIKSKNPLYTKEKIAIAIEEVFKNYTGERKLEFEIVLYLKKS